MICKPNVTRQGNPWDSVRHFPGTLLRLSRQPYQRISRHTRTLIVLLLLELVALVFAIWFATRSYHRVATVYPSGYLNLRSLLVLHIGTLALFCVVSAAVPFLSWLFTRRIIELTRTVRQHIATKRPVVALENSREDEIGDLVEALNQLGQAYHASLQKVARRAHEMTALHHIAATINETLDLQQVLDISLSNVLTTVNLDRGGIYMWDRRVETLNLVSYRGFSTQEVRDLFLRSLGQDTAGRAARNRRIVIARPAGKGLQIAIPLITVPGQLLGVLFVDSETESHLTRSTVRLLETIAHQIALAIDKAQLHQQVTAHAIELEGLVAERTRELNEAVEALEVAFKKATEADEMKSNLLLTVSHELRTPLTTIMGCTAMLADNHQRLSADQLELHLRDIAEEADKLTELVCNLLDMSRIEAGMLHFDFQIFNLEDLLENTIRAARLRFSERPIQLDLAGGLSPVRGDPRRVQQIIDNLLNNADKFSPPGAPIQVRAEERAGELLVTVSDQGPGIAPEHVESIFDRFVQAEALGDSGRHGIGLGLSICQGIVNEHGGRIWVDSQVGQGSAFHFTLPSTESLALTQTAMDGMLVVNL